MNVDLESLRSFPIWRTTVLYAGVLFCGVCLFFFLHHLGNQLDFDLAKKRIGQAFERKNLTEITHAGSVFPLKSVQSLMGLGQFGECEVLLAVLAGAEGSGSPRSALRKMIQPDRLRSDRYPIHQKYCAGLEAIAAHGDGFEHQQLKTRYWWGFKAVYGILLRHFEIFEIRYLFQTTIYFSYLLLVVALMAFSTRVALIFSPFIIFGMYFSGIPFFSHASVAPAYILSILAGAVMVLLVKRKVSDETLNLASFVIGMFSTYFWFFDGHTILILPLLASTVYFGCRVHSNPGKSARRALTCTMLYVAGFFICFVLGQLIKAAFLGWHLVIGSAMGSTLSHLGHFGMRKGDGLGLLPYFYDLTMLGPVAGRIFSILSVFALLAAAALSVYQSIKESRPELRLDFLLPLGLILYTYMLFLLGNDGLHSIARFGFVTHALAWVSLLAVLVNLRYGDISQATLLK